MHALAKDTARVGRASAHALSTLLAIGVVLAISASGAAAWGPPGGLPHSVHGRLQGLFRHHQRGHTQICSGTTEAPGTLAGVYYGTVFVEGACAVNAG